MRDEDETPPLDGLPARFPLPPMLRNAPPAFAAAIVRLTERLLTDAPPAWKTQAAAFFARLFHVPAAELSAVALAFQAAHDTQGRPTLEEISALTGWRNKQNVKIAIARAVSSVPELGALVQHLRLYFIPADELRLRAALDAGATFPRLLERNAKGYLVSPVRAWDGKPVSIPPATRRRVD